MRPTPAADTSPCQDASIYGAGAAFERVRCGSAQGPGTGGSGCKFSTSIGVTLITLLWKRRQ
eukprot:1303968-Pyramimonas_sp.AAC.1